MAMLQKRRGRTAATLAVAAVLGAAGLWAHARDDAVMDWYRARGQTGLPASGVGAETYRIVFGGLADAGAPENALAEALPNLSAPLEAVIKGRTEMGLVVGAGEKILRPEGFSLTPTRYWRPGGKAFEDTWIMEWTVPAVSGILDRSVAEWTGARLDGFGPGAWAVATRTGGEGGAAIVYQGTR